MPKVIFIMGTSGSGKTTVLKESGLLDRPEIIYAPSWTTRPIRPGEVNGTRYNFVDDKKFQDAIENNAFLEFAQVHKFFFYGTPLSEINEILSQNKNPLKEIDMHGLLKIQQEHKIDNQYFSLFLKIPIDLSIERINHRGILPKEQLEARIASATYELEQAPLRCNYIVDATQPLELVIGNVIDIIQSEIGNE